MDDEDKAEAEEARQVSTKSEFAGLGSTEDEINKRAPLMDLLRSSSDTMGFNLLRKMGWKDGQGIGPRIWREAVLDNSTSAEKHLFAPKNSKLILIMRKNDRKGLGYQGEDVVKRADEGTRARSEDEDATDKKSTMQPRKNGAFGVGILNDTGSDDEDPFSLGPRISYSKVLGSDKKKKKKAGGRVESNSNPLLSKRPVFVSAKANKALTGFRKCHDGRLPLEGFLLSVAKIVHEMNKYPPPKVPIGWKSAKLVKGSETSASGWESSSDLAKSSVLEPSSRGTILGEAPLPSKSVFDFMKPDARARLVTLTKNESLPPARSESIQAITSDSDAMLQIPALDPSIASSALGRGVGGFIPYTDNPSKLARYRTYLSYSAGFTLDNPIQPPELSKEEWHREMQEFAHAATIFKPMTGSIATRFTTASNTSLLSQSSDSIQEKNAQPPPIKSPAEEAAALSMFGPLTRSSTFFYPSRLLCKRFNVPVPAHVNSGNEGATSNKSSQRDNQQVLITNPSASTTGLESGANIHSRFQPSGFQIAETQEPVQSHHGDTADKSEVIDRDRNAALEQDRAGDDVFKAIFGSDSEDD